MKDMKDGHKAPHMGGKSGMKKGGMGKRSSGFGAKMGGRKGGMAKGLMGPHKSQGDY